jgi:hypothetical protein
MKLLVVTAYVIKCGFGADNQHYHTQKPRCDSTEMYPSISKCFIHATVVRHVRKLTANQKLTKNGFDFI